MIEYVSQECSQLFVGDVGLHQLYLLQTGENLREDLLRDAGESHVLVQLQIFQTQTRPQVVEQRGGLNKTMINLLELRLRVTC